MAEKLPLEGDIIMVCRPLYWNRAKFFWVEKVWSSRIGTHYRLVPLTQQYKRRVRERSEIVMQDWFRQEKNFSYRIEFTKVSRESIYGMEAKNERVGKEETQQSCGDAWAEAGYHALRTEVECARPY